MLGFEDTKNEWNIWTSTNTITFLSLIIFYTFSKKTYSLHHYMTFVESLEPIFVLRLAHSLIWHFPVIIYNKIGKHKRSSDFSNTFIHGLWIIFSRKMFSKNDCFNAFTLNLKEKSFFKKVSKFDFEFNIF